jgi:protein ImuB
VEIGQTVPQAMARCADIVLRTAQPAAEEEARAGLMAAAFSVSPQVEDTAPGVCTIHVGGVAPERREAAMRAAVAELAKLGLRATAGLGETPLVAWYAARFGDVRAAEGGRGSDGEGAARGRLGEPSLPGCVCIREAETLGFLRDLPLGVAEPLAETAVILAGWGVRTLGELTDLSKADVTQRLGPAGLALWERAAGEVKRPLTFVSPAQTFAAEMMLEHEIETLEPLLFILRRFVDRLALELRTAGWVAGEMSLGLRLSDETVYARDFRLPEPTAQEEILFRVLHTHLETLHTAATVRGATLECRPVRPLTRQQGLFESGLRDPHGFSETLARVSAVVGADRVGTPVLENTHRADAVMLVAPPAVVPPPVEEGIHARRGLPLRRFRLPVAATVELEGILPAFVWTPVMSGAVKALAGPWRGSGDWWDDGRRWAREEWDAELEAGGVYRLMRTPKGWFVEGEYD